MRWSAHAASSSASAGEACFQSADNVFPAASFCGGAVERDVAAVDDPDPATSGFIPKAGGWSNEYMPPGLANHCVRYALNSGLPTAEQLSAVSAYNGRHNPAVRRKGAALAAGWSPGGGSNTAWTGEVSFGGRFFIAVVVKLDSGMIHWDYVDSDYIAPVCLHKG
jgi:hypothetical protein